QVLPSTFPTTITIFAGAPNDDGSEVLNSTGVYIKAIISGTITIQDLLVLTGSISVTLQVGTPSFIVIQGAVSTSIKFLGSLSGSIYLGVYSADPTNPSVINPGIVGRVTLALNASVVPGVKFNGFFLLEVNLFVNPIASLQISTFKTCADLPSGATHCSSSRGSGPSRTRSSRSRSTRTACRSTAACALGRRAEATARTRRQTPGSVAVSD